MEASFGIIVALGALALLTIFFVFGLMTNKIFYNPGAKSGIILERKEALDALDEQIRRGTKLDVSKGIREYHDLYRSKTNVLRSSS